MNVQLLMLLNGYLVDFNKNPVLLVCFEKDFLIISHKTSKQTNIFFYIGVKFESLKDISVYLPKVLDAKSVMNNMKTSMIDTIQVLLLQFGYEGVRFGYVSQ